jgi:large subunit ribosomal protein L4e
MFSPTKTYRRWHRKVNKNQRRYAIVSALAASSSVPLVMARGHRVDAIPEIPLVVSTETIQNLTKTSAAIKLLKALNAFADVERVKHSRKLRAGKGKMRNRRYRQRRGPLIIYGNKGPLTKAFRNLPGVELCSVTRLNLLQLAPGGHLGRFVIWTKDAFAKLDQIYGTYKKGSSQKFGYRLPRPVMSNSDLSRIINSSEIQNTLRNKKRQRKSVPHKKNPLKNLGVMIKLNPYAKTQRRRELLRSCPKAIALANDVKYRRALATHKQKYAVAVKKAKKDKTPIPKYVKPNIKKDKKKRRKHAVRRSFAAKRFVKNLLKQ